MSDDDVHTPTDAGAPAPAADTPPADKAPRFEPPVADKAPRFEAPAASGFVSTGPTPGTGGQADPGRPEILVGAAFAGGLALALVLKKLGSHD